MKKGILFLISIMLFVIFCPQTKIAFAETKDIYGKIQSEGANFYSSPDESSALFELPNTYFVKIDSPCGDYFKCSYQSLIGYIKKDKVKLMKGSPKNPYAYRTFKVIVPYSLYKEPTQTSQSVFSLNQSFRINYLGKKTGQYVSTRSNEWFYSYIVSNNNTYYGYVFSELTDELTIIENNNEFFEEIIEDDIFSTTQNESNIPLGTKIMLIVSIAFPSLLILYFLIKPAKIMQTQPKKKSKSAIKKIKHKDYFEFDENEL